VRIQSDHLSVLVRLVIDSLMTSDTVKVRLQRAIYHVRSTRSNSMYLRNPARLTDQRGSYAFSCSSCSIHVLHLSGLVRGEGLVEAQPHLL